MMEKKKRLIILAIAIILVIILVVVVFGNKNKKNDENLIGNNSETNITTEGETKKIESNKLAETREYQGLEISNIRFEISDGLNSLKADVKNPTSHSTEDQYIDFHIYDKEDKKIGVLTAHIYELAPGEEQPVTSTLVTNGKELESYDVVITKHDEPSPRDKDVSSNTSNQ